GSYAQQYAFTLAGGPRGAGQLQFTVTIDSANQVYERNNSGTAESNNTSSISEASVLAGPDLQVTGVTVGPPSGLLVSSSSTSSILRYDRATGAFLDAFVPGGSGGLNFSIEPVIGPDGNLYVSSLNNNSILRFDGRTGAFLDTFVPDGSGGLDG